MPSLSTNPQQFNIAAEAAQAKQQAEQSHIVANAPNQPPQVQPISANQNQIPTVKLRTGELVDAATYNSLSPADQVQLSQLGIAGFNDYKFHQSQQTTVQAVQPVTTTKPTTTPTITTPTTVITQTAPTNSIKLDDGEYVDKTAFNALSTSDQAQLMKLGVTGFNAYQQQQQATFLANNTELLAKTTVNGVTTNEYVPNTFFNELTQLAQIVLKGEGVDAFNKWASTQTIATVYNDAGWKPDFTKPDPYAGMPSWYQAVEAAGFVPSPINGSTPPSQNYVPLTIGTTLPTNVGQTVFTAGQKAGTIPANAIYSGYDPLTGKVSYSNPLTGQQAFAQGQANGTIPSNATFTSYDAATGTVRYTIPKTASATMTTPTYPATYTQADFNADIASGKIPKGATFTGYNAQTGAVSYSLPYTYSQAQWETDKASGKIPSNAVFTSFNSQTGVVSYTVPSGNPAQQQAIMAEINTAITAKNPNLGNVDALNTAIEDAGYWNNSLLNAKRDLQTGLLYDSSGHVLTPQDQVKIEWNALTPDQQATVAGAYSNDLYRSNPFAETIKNIQVSANQAGIIGQLSVAQLTGFAIPLAKDLTGQNVSTLERVNAGITIAADVLTMGGASLIVDTAGAVGKLAVTGLTGALGTYGVANSVVSFTEGKIPQAVAQGVLGVIGIGSAVYSVAGDGTLTKIGTAVQGAVDKTADIIDSTGATIGHIVGADTAAVQRWLSEPTFPSEPDTLETVVNPYPEGSQGGVINIGGGAYATNAPISIASMSAGLPIQVVTEGVGSESSLIQNIQFGETVPHVGSQLPQPPASTFPLMPEPAASLPNNEIAPSKPINMPSIPSVTTAVASAALNTINKFAENTIGKINYVNGAYTPAGASQTNPIAHLTSAGIPMTNQAQEATPDMYITQEQTQMDAIVRTALSGASLMPNLTSVVSEPKPIPLAQLVNSVVSAPTLDEASIKNIAENMVKLGYTQVVDSSTQQITILTTDDIQSIVSAVENAMEQANQTYESNVENTQNENTQNEQAQQAVNDAIQNSIQNSIQQNINVTHQQVTNTIISAIQTEIQQSIQNQQQQQAQQNVQQQNQQQTQNETQQNETRQNVQQVQQQEQQNEQTEQQMENESQLQQEQEQEEETEPTPVIPPYIPSGEGDTYNPQRTIQGTIVARVGAPKGYPDGQWKVMPPPYTHVYTEKQAPIGTYKFPTGSGSTLASLQIIGGAPRKPIDVEMDLGVERLRVYTIKNKVYGEWIRNEAEAYKGKEEKIEEQIPTRSQNISKRTRDLWERQDHLPDYFEPSPEMHKTLLPQYSKGKMKVYAVDMAYLRTKYADVSIGDRIGQELTLGGHSRVYWKLIKPNEIYVSNKLDGVDRDATVVHEYREFNTMGKGKEYSPAHNEDANPLEIKVRRNPRIAMSLINKEATIAEKGIRLASGTFDDQPNDVDENEAAQELESKGYAQDIDIEPTLEPETAEVPKKLEDAEKIEEKLAQKVYEAQAEVESSKESSSESKLAPIMDKLEPAYRRMLRRKDEKDDLTLTEYQELTGKTMPAHLIQDRFGRKYVSWENAMDNIAAEYGYENPEEMKADLEREIAQKQKRQQAENLLATSQEALDRIEKEKLNEQLRIRPEPRRIEPSTTQPIGVSPDTGKTQEQPRIELAGETNTTEIPEPVVISGVKPSEIIEQPTADELKFILFRTSKGLPTKEEKEKLNALAEKYPKWGAKQKDLFVETLIPLGTETVTTPTTTDAPDGKKTANVTTQRTIYRTTYSLPEHGSVRIYNVINRIAKEEKAKIAQQEFITPNGLGKEERPDLAIGGIKTYLVNENYIRKNYEMNYSKSASDKTMPMVIPQGEIWVSRGVPEVEIYQNLLRAYLARDLVNNGKEKHEAQQTADKTVDNYRNALGALRIEIQRHQEKTNGKFPRYQAGQKLTKEGALDRRTSQAMPKSLMDEKKWWTEEPKKKEQPYKPQPRRRESYLGFELSPRYGGLDQFASGGLNGV